MNWLEQHNILNILLGESLHTEVLKRSSPLFRFLFRNKKITLEQINQICDLAFEKHDTYRKTIFNVISDIAELMTLDELDFLFKKVQNLPPQDLDQDILHLVKSIGKSVSLTVTTISKVKNNPDLMNDENITASAGESVYDIKITDENAQPVAEHGKDVVVIEEVNQEENEKLIKIVKEIVNFLWNIIAENPNLKQKNPQMINTVRVYIGWL